MLVLGRSENQQIVIGKAGDVLTEPIVVTVTRVPVNHGSRVRIGIDAGKEINIRRAEIPEEGNDGNCHD